MLDVIPIRGLCIKAVYAWGSSQKFINNTTVAKSLKETYVKNLQRAVIAFNPPTYPLYRNTELNSSGKGNGKVNSLLGHPWLMFNTLRERTRAA